VISTVIPKQVTAFKCFAFSFVLHSHCLRKRNFVLVCMRDVIVWASRDLLMMFMKLTA